MVLEAENDLYKQPNRSLRTSESVLAALFQAYLASNKIANVESLIAMHGSTFLDVHSCGAFIMQCASLRLYDTTPVFLDRMEHADETGFPRPQAKTYNILLRGF